jgi:hypothetical protein
VDLLKRTLRRDDGPPTAFLPSLSHRSRFAQLAKRRTKRDIGHRGCMPGGRVSARGVR